MAVAKKSHNQVCQGMFKIPDTHAPSNYLPITAAHFKIGPENSCRIYSRKKRKMHTQIHRLNLQYNWKSI